MPDKSNACPSESMLLAIDDISMPLKRNLCYYITKPTVQVAPVLTPETAILMPRTTPRCISMAGRTGAGQVPDVVLRLSLARITQPS